MTLTPGTLIDGARMYAAAADAVNNDYPNSLHVLSHLLGMSIELSLKAFLCSKGATERELRKYGHDLGLLLERAEALGLTETGSRHFRLNVLGTNYEERLFAYPKPAALTVIVPGRLREITHEIISEVFVSLKGEELYDKLRDEPGLSIRSSYPDELDASNWAVKDSSAPTKSC